MLALTGDRAALLTELLSSLSGEEVTYPGRGGTRTGELPAGYQAERASLVVGRGDAAWDRAQNALRLWRPQRHAGLEVTPRDAALEEGGTVLVSRHVGPLLIVAPCRIVYVTESDSRFGFGYGTLAGHPLRGEEAFHVNRGPDGAVTGEIVAFSRPADLPTRIAAPAVRLAQRAATRRYLAGVGTYVANGD